MHGTVDEMVCLCTHTSWLWRHRVVWCAGCLALAGCPGVCCTSAPAFLPRVCFALEGAGQWTGEGRVLLLKMWGLFRFFRLGARVECVCFGARASFFGRVPSSSVAWFVCRVDPANSSGWVW